MSPVYEDFFLTVGGSEGSYTVEAQGPGAIRVPPLPFEYHRTDELDVELNRIREGFAPTRERMELLGTLLFNALFPRKIIRAFEHAPKVLDEGVNLRVKLIVRPPELSHLPWELLFDPDKGFFLAARLSYPIVRFIEAGIPVARLLARRPLRVLHLQASPPETSPVEGIASENAVRQAIGAHGYVKPVRRTTPEDLQDVMREQPGFHILHYHGHGKFDFQRRAGHLCLHDEGGGIHWLDGEMLATYLDSTSVRLVVLTACETALDSNEKRFSGIAQQLMHSGSLPAVVAMQFAIPEASALAFTRAFYKALVDEHPVDAAVVEGRKAILSKLGKDPFAAPDWATPVLFMRSENGDILTDRLACPGLDQVRESETGEIARVGLLPRSSLMPLRPDPHFVDREKELRKLDRLLRAGSTAAIGQVTAATGLGGIGKTELAVQYAHRYGQRYTGGIFWLDAGSPEGLGSQVALCGGPEGMELPDFGELTLSEQIARVRKEWAGPTLRLLVLDNVDDPEVVEEWRPVTGGCRVLITSRSTYWPSWLGVNEVRLDTLPRRKAIELLCKGRPEALKDGRKETADEICDLLGDLPLAVAMAARYLEFYKYDVTLTQYLQDLRSQPVLDNPALVEFVQDPSPTRHIQNVAATFQLSYGRLDAEDESDLLAMKLFHLTSHFAPVSTPRRLLVEAAGLDPEREDDRRRATKGIRRLTGLGLMEEQAEGRLLLHRLVAEFARAHPAPGESAVEAWRQVAGATLAFSARENEKGLSQGLAREITHVRKVVGDSRRQDWDKVGQLHYQLGRHLHLVGAYDEARVQLEHALVADEGILGPEHPDVARDVALLGSVLRDLGEFEAARAHHERALAIYRATLGRLCPEVADVLNELGLVLLDMGDLPGALRRHRQALSIGEAVFGADHPEVAATVNNLGLVLHDMGELERARQHYERALSIDETAFGPNHPRVAIRVNNLGLVLKDMGKPAQALSSLERALSIDEVALGPDHPKVAIRLNNLGLVLLEMDKPEAARQRFERALKMGERVFGPHHHTVANRTNNLGRALEKMGELGPAREHYERALDIWEKALGPEHSQVATGANNLGRVLQKMGDLRGARKQYERALAIRRQVYGEDHADTQTVLDNLKALDNA